MALTRWDPFTTLARLDEDFDQLVRRAWGTPREGSQRTSTLGYVPAIDMRNREQTPLLASSDQDPALISD